MRKLDELFLRSLDKLPTFTILQAGAYSPEHITIEPFHDLAERFRGSRILVCDPDTQMCEEQNHLRQPDDPEYFPMALGSHGQASPFYLTREAVWRSPYKPNEMILQRYQHMEGALPESVDMTTMTGADQFVRDAGLGDVDLVRVLLPWSGLNLLASGENVLKHTLAVSVDASLIPLYEQQETFGDICQYLATQGFVFHKFAGLYGRTFNPVVLREDPDFASHHLWCHAIFLRDIADIKRLSPVQLQKLGLIADMYGSQDVAIIALMEYDIRHGTEYGKVYGGLDG